MTTTEQERAALEEWYGERAAHEEIADLRRPTWPEYAASKAAARDAAWAIIRRAKAAVAGGAQ